MRRRRAEKRETIPDPKFSSEMVARFVSIVMTKGKKTVAEGIVYGALDLIKDKTPEDSPLKAFNKAIDNVRPRLEVKGRRVGGATYQVPTEVRPERAQALAMRWIIDAARARGEHTMMERVAGEIMDAANDRGTAVKKRDDTHKMAEANKAFAHFRW